MRIQLSTFYVLESLKITTLVRHLLLNKVMCTIHSYPQLSLLVVVHVISPPECLPICFQTLRIPNISCTRFLFDTVIGLLWIWTPLIIGGLCYLLHFLWDFEFCIIFPSLVRRRYFVEALVKTTNFCIWKNDFEKLTLCYGVKLHSIWCGIKNDIIHVYLVELISDRLTFSYQKYSEPNVIFEECG